MAEKIYIAVDLGAGAFAHAEFLHWAMPGCKAGMSQDTVDTTLTHLPSSGNGNTANRSIEGTRE